SALPCCHSSPLNEICLRQPGTRYGGEKVQRRKERSNCAVKSRIHMLRSPATVKAERDSANTTRPARSFSKPESAQRLLLSGRFMCVAIERLAIEEHSIEFE